MMPGDLYLILTDRFGTASAVNMACFTIVAESPGGGTDLHPVSLNQRYDGVATHVAEGIEAYRDLPGFLPVELVLPEGRGAARGMVNMARVAGVVGGDGHCVISIPGTTSTVRVPMALDDLMARMRTEA